MSLPRRTLKTAADLAEAGLIPKGRLEQYALVGARYAIAIPPAMAELIDRTDPADPIARQFVPDIREFDHDPAEHADPIGDDAMSPVPGIVHRYRDRVLLKITGICPVYCRFCFRREMVGPDAGRSLDDAQLATALAYIRAHPEIWEVILTGGDPFILSPRRVAEVTAALSDIPHVKILRWHTRVPVVAPERISADFIEALHSPRKTVFIAIHTNHPRELTGAARTAISHLAEAGFPLLSQTVLLRGVNDNAATLEALFRGLVEARVTPYYLHHGDLAPGTRHFRTTLAQGQKLMAALRGRVSGIALPTYVVDIPGAHGKVPAGPANVIPHAVGGTYTLIDPSGVRHTYEDHAAADHGPVKSS